MLLHKPSSGYSWNCNKAIFRVQKASTKSSRKGRTKKLYHPKPCGGQSHTGGQCIKWAVYREQKALIPTLIPSGHYMVSVPHVCLRESTIVSGHYRGGLYTPCVSHKKYHYLWSLQGWSLYPMCVSQNHYLWSLQGLYTPCLSHRKYQYLWSLQGWSLCPICVSQKVPLSLLLQGWSLYPMCVSQKVPLSLVTTGVVSIPYVSQKVPLSLVTTGVVLSLIHI